MFQVDESGYNQIALQVRDSEFEKELERREKEILARQEHDVKLLRLQAEKQLSESINKKEEEISDKDKLIADLRAKLDASETEMRRFPSAKGLSRRFRQGSAQVKPRKSLPLPRPWK